MELGAAPLRPMGWTPEKQRSPTLHCQKSMAKINFVSSTAKQEIVCRLTELSPSPKALDLIHEIRHSEKFYIEAHPLGMYAAHFVCARHSVRVHCWNIDSIQFRDDLGRIHDHIWNLSSHVLRGSIRNETFSVVPSPAGILLWERDYEKNTVSVYNQRVSLRLVGDQAIPEGGFYQLPAGTLHRTTESPPITVTIVEATPTTRRKARIVGDAAQQGRPNGSTRRRRVQTDEFLTALAG